MSRYVRTYECENCGRMCRRKRSTGQDLLCIECSHERSLLAARQMAQRSGELYDKWLKSAGPRGRPRTDRKE